MGRMLTFCLVSVKEQPKRVINVHESHSGYLMAQVGTPFELVEAKWQRDMREARDRHNRLQQMQEARAQVVRQQQAAMMTAQQQQQQQQQLQQQQGGQQQPQQVQQSGQQQMRPQGQGGQTRLGPNGQPLPNMAPSQQQLLTAVAAANAARQGAGVPNGNAANAGRPPSQGQNTAANQVPNAQLQQQMQMVQAQQLAARQAQAQAQAQNRVPGSGTPHSQAGTLSTSPYSHQSGELPNGEGAHGSPAMVQGGGPQSSPSQQAQALQTNAMGRVPSVPMAQAQNLRLPSGGSPQLSNTMLGQQQGQSQQMINPQINNALMQQVIATLQASGQQATPETVRALQLQILRNVSGLSGWVSAIAD